MVQYHPTRLDHVFGALADPTRRAVLARLDRGEHTISELAEPYGMSLTGFIKHLGILEDAGLIERHKAGRVVSCRLKHGALKGAREWLERHESFWKVQLDRLEAYLERKENERWNTQSTKAPASPSGGRTTRRSRRSTRHGRTRSS
jgi:DNA-binding transcriptional ArsR family regulator